MSPFCCCPKPYMNSHVWSTLKSISITITLCRERMLIFVLCTHCNFYKNSVGINSGAKKLWNKKSAKNSLSKKNSFEKKQLGKSSLNNEKKYWHRGMYIEKVCLYITQDSMCFSMCCHFLHLISMDFAFIRSCLLYQRIECWH